MDKATLLDRLFANRMLFEKTVSQVSEASMLESIGLDQRTGKGIIAHLTAWEQLNRLPLDVPLLILYNGHG